MKTVLRIGHIVRTVENGYVGITDMGDLRYVAQKLLAAGGHIEAPDNFWQPHNPNEQVNAQATFYTAKEWAAEQVGDDEPRKSPQVEAWLDQLRQENEFRMQGW